MRQRLKLKNSGALLLCALAIICLSLLPVVVFYITDAALLKSPRASIATYTPIALDGDSFYLTRMLRSRTVNAGLSARPNDAQKADFYLASQTMRSGMRQDGGMRQYALTMLDDLQTAGAVPLAWAQEIKQTIGEDSAGFYVSTDTLGFVTICYFVGENDFSSIMPYSITFESKTGAVVSAWLSSETPCGAVDAATALPAMVKQAGLSALEDWQAPLHTDYAQSGLYSASGGVLVTCVSDAYSYNGGITTTQRYFYSIVLSHMAQERMQNAGYSTDTSRA